MMKTCRRWRDVHHSYLKKLSWLIFHQPILWSTKTSGVQLLTSLGSPIRRSSEEPCSTDPIWARDPNWALGFVWALYFSRSIRLSGTCFCLVANWKNYTKSRRFDEILRFLELEKLWKIQCITAYLLYIYNGKVLRCKELTCIYHSSNWHFRILFSRTLTMWLTW